MDCDIHEQDHEILACKPEFCSNQQALEKPSEVLNNGTCCCCEVTSVVSDPMQPHRRQPTRLPRPWDPQGKNTGVVAIAFSDNGA